MYVCDGLQVTVQNIQCCVFTCCRIVLESRNHDACKGKKCDLLADRPGLYAHGTLQLSNPPQQVVLFGDVTPFECAAAHGHVQTMKLLIQASGQDTCLCPYLHLSWSPWLAASKLLSAAQHVLHRCCAVLHSSNRLIALI